MENYQCGKCNALLKNPICHQCGVKNKLPSHAFSAALADNNELEKMVRGMYILYNKFFTSDAFPFWEDCLKKYKPSEVRGALNDWISRNHTTAPTPYQIKENLEKTIKQPDDCEKEEYMPTKLCMSCQQRRVSTKGDRECSTCNPALSKDNADRLELIKIWYSLPIEERRGKSVIGYINANMDSQYKARSFSNIIDGIYQ